MDNAKAFSASSVVMPLAASRSDCFSSSFGAGRFADLAMPSSVTVC
jgi:hypothetical protein